MRIAIITGASSGLGAAYAQELSRDPKWERQFDECWLIARRRDRLETLSHQLSFPTRIFAYDLQDEQLWQEMDSVMAKASTQVALLIQAAGLGRLGEFGTITLEDHKQMLRINVEALMKFHQWVMPHLASDARLITIASVAGFMPQTGFNVYAASKAFVISHSRALNDELRQQGASVTVVCPGPMETEFFDVASGSKHDGQSRANAIKRLGLEDPETVVQRSLNAAMRRKDMIVTGLVGKLLLFTSKVVPHRLVLKIERWIGL